MPMTRVCARYVGYSTLLVPFAQFVIGQRRQGQLCCCTRQKTPQAQDAGRLVRGRPVDSGRSTPRLLAGGSCSRHHHASSPTLVPVLTSPCRLVSETCRSRSCNRRGRRTVGRTANTAPSQLRRTGLSTSNASCSATDFGMRRAKRCRASQPSNAFNMRFKAKWR